jgi:hypothetical protein
MLLRMTVLRVILSGAKDLLYVSRRVRRTPTLALPLWEREGIKLEDEVVATADPSFHSG